MSQVVSDLVSDEPQRAHHCVAISGTFDAVKRQLQDVDREMRQT